MPPGAVACRITVVCVTDAKNRIRTKPLTAEHWKLKRPLTPGLIYQWQVIALDRAGHAVARVPARTGAARFKVLESDRAVSLAEYRRRFGQSRLALGTLYAHEGLLDAAEKEFQALAHENSASNTARNLLQSLHTLRDKT
jgi:hypothetical protein